MITNPTSKIAQAKAALLAQQQQQQQPLQPRQSPSPIKIQFGDRTNAFKSAQSPTFATLKSPTLNKTPNVATNVATTTTTITTTSTTNSPNVTRTINSFANIESKAPTVAPAPPALIPTPVPALAPVKAAVPVNAYVPVIPSTLATTPSAETPKASIQSSTLTNSTCSVETIKEPVQSSALATTATSSFVETIKAPIPSALITTSSFAETTKAAVAHVEPVVNAPVVSTIQSSALTITNSSSETTAVTTKAPVVSEVPVVAKVPAPIKENTPSPSKPVVPSAPITVSAPIVPVSPPVANKNTVIVKAHEEASAPNIPNPTLTSNISITIVNEAKNEISTPTPISSASITSSTGTIITSKVKEELLAPVPSIISAVPSLATIGGNASIAVTTKVTEEELPKAEPFSAHMNHTSIIFTSKTKEQMLQSTPAENPIQSPTRTNPVSRPASQGRASGMMPQKFHWKHGGEMVKVTGTFDNWKESILLKKLPSTRDEFIAIVDLDRTKNNQFKFVVDGVWRCSTEFDTEYDFSGNLNNVLPALSQDNNGGPGR